MEDEILESIQQRVAGPQDDGKEIGEFIIRGFWGIVHRPVFYDSREKKGFENWIYFFH
jgi:hypothetical protein